jgi:ribose transport system permease protein
MIKLLGIFCLLVFLCAFTAFFEPNFLTAFNIENNLKRIGPFGIIGIGALFVIITGGIDLSIGAVVGLVGVLLPWLLKERGFGVPAALCTVILVSIGIGLLHGLLITKLKLQPFVVTLCGLMVYRSQARFIANETTQGFGNDYTGLKSILVGRIPGEGGIPWGDSSFAIPTAFVIMAGLAVVAAIFLNKTIYGRYLLALGRNEQAARFSGINTDRMVIVAYVLCSLFAGLGGIIFALEVNSVQPSNQGAGYEMYAIAAAVLGGCSLRGGEGSITGVVIGSAVVQVLYNAIVLLGISSTLEGTIIGLVILAGVIVDELVKRLGAARRAAREARLATAGDDA